MDAIGSLADFELRRLIKEGNEEAKEELENRIRLRRRNTGADLYLSSMVSIYRQGQS